MLSASYNCGNTIAFFAFCPFYSLANSRCFISVYLSSCLLFRLSRFGSPTTAWTRINTRGLRTCILSPNHIQMIWGLEQGKFFFFSLTKESGQPTYGWVPRNWSTNIFTSGARSCRGLLSIAKHMGVKQHTCSICPSQWPFSIWADSDSHQLQ